MPPSIAAKSPARVSGTTPAKPKAKPQPKAKRPPARKSKPKTASPVKRNWWLLALEATSLLVAAVLTTMYALGYSASGLSGSGFFSNLLPFAGGVVVLIVLAALLLIGWQRLRACLASRVPPLPAALSVVMALGMLWFVFHDGYTQVFGNFRTLVGGKQEAERVTLAHQVFAAYRRHDGSQLQKMLVRAESFNPAIAEAAKALNVDVYLLQGVAATESSFMPRDSHDGGKGLFQITAIPKFISQQAAGLLNVSEPQVNDPRHNAFLAAATLKHYLREMRGDLFLSLLAYNIGPKNGGLRFIMQQYGASDFVTMQPYLQQLPRDYPIRVLSYALAFKLWQQEGKLLAYEEGDNALRIQQIGIPGF